MAASGTPGSRPPCSAVMGPFGWLVAFWSIPLVYDTLTFMFTTWKAYEFWKAEVDTPLFSIIWRDGLLYFFAIFSMNLTNVIIFLSVPPALRAVNLSATLVLEVILSCRLILNLRGAPSLSVSNSQVSQPKGSANNSKMPFNRSHVALADQEDVGPVETASVRLEPVRGGRAKDDSSCMEMKVRPWNP
ncbi:hypothetical protein CPB84DRAFT_1765327 [Gymnopilus junonius]|uniref:Transmembrane protein n=1 Tax=Gymnopilus junonius TaxID=109634 RepID=A0A9P5NZF5_GYMJU|nr:hypothetical protein CPB84DRAFT_1765327 [Gymnopilus junonius]